MSNFTAAALLAGGKSRRMGFDKQLFHAMQDRLFAHLLPALTKRFNDVLVVTGYPELFRGLGVRTVRDIIPGLGPLSGIHAAVSEASSEYVYILACDMPKIDLDYIDYLIDRIKHSFVEPAACVTRYGDWIEPFHAFYGKNALPVIEEDLLAQKSSVYYFLQKVNTLYIPEPEARRFSPDWSLFHNLNTREDYANFLKEQQLCALTEA
jgi:molybdopterin-guanine dinucleotide biosynthesis protein A